MSVERANLVDLELVAHHETDKAWFVSVSGHTEDAVWLPKSLAERGVGPEADLFTLPRWKAEECGLVSSKDGQTGRLI